MNIDTNKIPTASIDTVIADINRLPQDLTEIGRIVRPVGRILMFHNLPNSKDGADYFLNHRYEKRCPTPIYRMIYDQGGCSETYEDIQVYNNEAFISVIWDFRKGTPLIDYAKKVRDYCGCTIKKITEVAGNTGITHFFSRTQFGVPTKVQYDNMIAYFKLDQMPGFMTLEEIIEADAAYLSQYGVTGILPGYYLPPGKRSTSNVLVHNDKDAAIDYLTKLFTRKDGDVLILAGAGPDRLIKNEGWSTLV